MSLSYCVSLVYRHAVLVVRWVELSNDVKADTLVKLSMKRSDHRRIVTNVCIVFECTETRLIYCNSGMQMFWYDTFVAHDHLVHTSPKFSQPPSSMK